MKLTMKVRTTAAILIIAAAMPFTGSAFVSKGKYTINLFDSESLRQGLVASQSAAEKVKSAAVNSPSPAPALIGEEKAKEIALTHAGVNAEDANFVRVKLDKDDRRQEYEVEFWAGNIEYDYEIDAITGEILSYDHDAEHYAPKTTPKPTAKPSPKPTASAPKNKISAAEAKQIALRHADFAENEVKRLKVEYEVEHGKGEYEVEFHVGRTEYNYEINAADGKISSFEADQDD